MYERAPTLDRSLGSLSSASELLKRPATQKVLWRTRENVSDKLKSILGSSRPSLRRHRCGDERRATAAHARVMRFGTQASGTQ